MKNKIREKLTAIMIGIALSAVVFMPACDTGGGDGATACPDLNGEWAVELTMESDTCGWIRALPREGTDYFTFTIYEETGEAEMYWRDEPADTDPLMHIDQASLACDDQEFTITSLPYTAELDDDCVTIDQFKLTGTFDSNDTFRGTLFHSRVALPSDCPYGCVDIYNLTATRR